MTSKAPTANGQQTSSLWRNRDFTLLWGGQTVSAFGSSMSDVAFGLLVLQITHYDSTHPNPQVAFVASIRALPFLVLTLPAGALMDVWDRKRVMLLSDLGRAACLASIAFALLIGHLTLAQLYVVAVAEGALGTLYNIAALAGVTRVVPKAQLGQATSATYVSSNTVSLVGPPLVHGSSRSQVHFHSLLMRSPMSCLSHRSPGFARSSRRSTRGANDTSSTSLQCRL